MTFKREAIEECLREIFDVLVEYNQANDHDNNRELFVFHMVDWLQDFEDLYNQYDMFGKPEVEIDCEKSNETVIGFLYHVVPHLNAAYSLLLNDIPPELLSHGNYKNIKKD